MRLQHGEKLKDKSWCSATTFAQRQQVEVPFHLEGDFKLQPDDRRVVRLLVAVTLQDLLSGVVAVDVKAGWGKKLFLESPKQFFGRC